MLHKFKLLSERIVTRYFEFALMIFSKIICRVTPIGNWSNLVNESMTTPSGLVMLLQNKNPLSRLCHESRGAEATDPTANDDGVKVLRYFVHVEALLEYGVTLLLVGNVGASRLPIIL